MNQGKTDWNRNHIERNKMDIILNPTGLKQTSQTTDLLLKNGFCITWNQPIKSRFSSCKSYSKKTHTLITEDMRMFVCHQGTRYRSNTQSPIVLFAFYGNFLGRPKDLKTIFFLIIRHR